MVIIILISWIIRTDNRFKRMAIKTAEALSGIEVALTKRYDMLTKLFAVAKGSTTHEKEVFSETVNLRKEMDIAGLKDANAKINEITYRIDAMAEAYPQLRSSEVFRELQLGVRDAEEHLQAARRLYNSCVTSYNTAIVVFPASIVARSQHLVPEEFFEAEESKKEDVDMTFK